MGQTGINPEPLHFKRIRTTSTPEQLHTTIKLIGSAIREGSVYPPIRDHAARLATKAAPKDYYGQIAEIWRDFLGRWRYVYDPQGVEWVTVSGPAIWQTIIGTPKRKGYGDCDDATVGIGSLAASVGMDVRIGTLSPPHSPKLFTHVFAQVKPPRGDRWVTVDPVVWPRQGLGYMAPSSRLAFWDLDGNLIEKFGQFPHGFESAFGGIGAQPDSPCTSMAGQLGDVSMYGQAQPHFNQFPDVEEDREFGFFGEADETSGPLDFQKYGLLGFGAYHETYGVLTGDQTPYVMAEYDESDLVAGPYVRTKAMEIDPAEMGYVRQYGVPRIGALALADDGDVYQWTQDPVSGLGFFKKLFKKARKFVRKKVKKLVHKIPFGKKIWKLGSKIHRTAMKLVRPMIRTFGKYAKRIAPIAAFVPGVGPAISAALVASGKAIDIAKKLGMFVDKKGKPIPKTKAQARAYAKALAASGKQMSKQKVQAYASRLARKGRGLSGQDWQMAGGRFYPVGSAKHTAVLRFVGVEGV